jgi:hypothetical protein
LKSGSLEGLQNNLRIYTLRCIEKAFRLWVIPRSSDYCKIPLNLLWRQDKDNAGDEQRDSSLSFRIPQNFSAVTTELYHFKIVSFTVVWPDSRPGEQRAAVIFTQMKRCTGMGKMATVQAQIKDVEIFRC